MTAMSTADKPPPPPPPKVGTKGEKGPGRKR